MNFALARRIRVNSGTAQSIIEWLETALKSERSSNLSEVVFYLAASPQEYLNLSFFWHEPSRQELENLFRLRKSSHRLDTRQLLEQQLYQLLWEYRSVGHYSTPAASALQLFVVPSQAYAKLRQPFIAAVKQLRQDIDGLVGLWVGEAFYSEKVRLIIRSDWKSLQAFHTFITSEQHQRLQADNQVLKAEATFSTEFAPLSWSLEKDGVIECARLL